MAKKKKKAPSCPTPGCRKPQKVKCGKCGKTLCADHQYESDHPCREWREKALAKKNEGAAPAKPKPGLVVVKHSKPAPSAQEEANDGGIQVHSRTTRRKKNKGAEVSSEEADNIIAALEKVRGSESPFTAACALITGNAATPMTSPLFHAAVFTIKGGDNGAIEKSISAVCELLSKGAEESVAPDAASKAAKTVMEWQAKFKDRQVAFSKYAAASKLMAALLDRCAADCCPSEDTLTQSLRSHVSALVRAGMGNASEGKSCGRCQWEVVCALGAVAAALQTRYGGKSLDTMSAELCSELQSDVWDGRDAATRGGSTLALCGLARGFGPAFLEKNELVSQMLLQGGAIIGEGRKADSEKQITMISAIRTFATCAGNVFEPFLFHHAIFPEVCIQLYVKSSSAVRKAIFECTMSLSKCISAHGIQRVLPPLIRIAKGESAGTMGHWRARVLTMSMLESFGSTGSAAFFRQMPEIVPAVMECLVVTKKEVPVAAQKALEKLVRNIKNPEIAGLVPEILAAMTNPAKTFECIEELMDTTFINSIDRQCLSIVIPIVLRGFRDGKGEMKKNACIVTGNICSLVSDVDHIIPFVPSLLPQLNKMLEHSNPDVRKVAQKAKQSLMKDVGELLDDGDVDGRPGVTMLSPRASADGNRRVALALKEAVGSDEGVSVSSRRMGSIAVDYMVEVAQYLLASVLSVPPTTRIRAMDIDDRIRPALKPSIDAAKVDNPEAIYRTLIAAFLQLRKANTRENSRRRTSSFKGAATLMKMENIILAFASKVLLTRTSLEMKVGRRYALLGMNGTGKTTLLDRLAQKDIAGFPKDVSVYYIRHEIVEESTVTVLDFIVRDLGEAKARSDAEKALDDLHFTEEMKHGPVNSLSGGWRMKLAVARSMMFDSDLLLLDEPTNHLDEASIRFLEEYITTQLTGTTVCVVSHDYEFVAAVATDIIHIHDQRLTQHPVGFQEFQKTHPDVVAALPKKDRQGEDGNNEGAGEGLASALELLDLDENDARKPAWLPINLPAPGKLQGVTSRGKTIMEAKDVTFHYPGNDRVIFSNAHVKVNLNTRACLLGANGAGKTTLLKLLIGELELEQDGINKGKISRHHNLRTAYIAQHSMHHLEESLQLTPCQYLQRRYYEGRDKEMSKRKIFTMTEEDKEAMSERGAVCAILSRVERSKKLYYELEKVDFKGVAQFRSLKDIERMPPHVMKLVRIFDEKLKAEQSGMDIRPVTSENLQKHLKEFGIGEDLATRKIRWMSGGQRCRLVLAAAMWSMPHLIVLDEPTNYLDNETVAALVFALRKFRGGVVTISHNADFVGALCKQHWTIKPDGSVEEKKVVRAGSKKKN